MQNSNTQIPSNPRSGIIYESGITDGYAYTRLAYDADTHTVVIMYSTGHIRRLDAANLGKEVLIWAERCAQCRAGLWPDMRLGPVGERLADRYTAHQQEVSA